MATQGTKTDSAPFKVLVVGAGIGGLATALALRRQGHIVEVFEKSSFSSEIGAAVGAAPNCTITLRKLGLEPLDHGGVISTGMETHESDGTLILRTEGLFGPQVNATPWVMIHRVALHTALKTLASSETGEGTPVKIHLSSRVIAASTEPPSIALQNGEIHHADLLVGADGVHSFTRRFVNPDAKPVQYGKCCYRWLAPFSALRDNEHTVDFSTREGRFLDFQANDRMLLAYTCSDGVQSNFLAFVPSAEGNLDETDKNALKSRLVESFKTFGPAPRALIDQTPPENLRIWQLLEMTPLEKWHTDRLALIGDACHPFVPFMGQGATMAIEDGAALATFLPRGTPIESIPARLQLFQECRKERVDTIQKYSRIRGHNLDDPEEPRPRGAKIAAWTKYACDHDAFAVAEKMFADYLAAGGI